MKIEEMITRLRQKNLTEADAEEIETLLRSKIEQRQPKEILDAEEKTTIETTHTLFCVEGHGEDQCQYLAETTKEDPWSRPSHTQWRCRTYEYAEILDTDLVGLSKLLIHVRVLDYAAYRRAVDECGFSIAELLCMLLRLDLPEGKR